MEALGAEPVPLPHEGQVLRRHDDAHQGRCRHQALLRAAARRRRRRAQTSSSAPARSARSTWRPTRPRSTPPTGTNFRIPVMHFTQLVGVRPRLRPQGPRPARSRSSPSTRCSPRSPHERGRREGDRNGREHERRSQDRRVHLRLRQQHRRQGERAEVVEYAAGLPHVAVAREYKYMCSDPGQVLIQDDIKEMGLNRVVVAACSPTMHEPTFRKAVADARPQPVPLPDGQHPRARLVGHRRPGRGHREGQAHRAGGHQPGRLPGAARAHHRAHELGRAGGRRRHRRHRGRPQDGAGRAPRHRGRARAVHRRPHGAVRQDVPHPGLLGLHPHAQDERPGQAPQHRPACLLRGRRGHRATSATSR